MDVVIISYFRNSSETLGRYLEQIFRLHDLFSRSRHSLSLVVGYGDSSDKTGEILFEELSCRVGAVLVECSHGGPDYGSIIHPERFKQLASVSNKLREYVPQKVDVVVWLESDLIWEEETLYRLIQETEFLDVVAPLVFHQNPSGKFYDTFAFRRNGIKFTNDPPYHPDLRDYILEMDSVGSCVAMRGSIFHQVYIPEEDVIVGMCRQVKDLGYEVYCDARLRIHHP